MALSAIVIGCDWLATLTVNPGDGANNSDVTAALTGGTVEAKLFQLSTVVTSILVDVDPGQRLVKLALIPNATRALKPGRGASLDVRVRTATGKVFPLLLADLTIDVLAHG